MDRLDHRNIVRFYELDEHNRIPMDLNCLLIQSEGKNILVDTGMGHKLSEKGLRNWALEWPEGNLEESLGKAGLKPEDVDIVINTHLHSDHCGGNTKFEDSEIVPTFPNAEYWVQRMEFADAMNTNSRTRNTYLPENFEPVWKNEQYRLLHGDTEVTSEVRCAIAPGHSRGHQCVIADDGSNPPVMFLADLSSYSLHMEKPTWVTAYDVEPLETITIKQKWQAWALEKEALLVFQHDLYTPLGKLVRNEEGKLEIEKVEGNQTLSLAK